MTAAALDPDLYRAFIVNHEAWYHVAATRGLPDHLRLPSLQIQLASKGGGVKWEFEIEEHDHGSSGKALRACIFDDAWAAFHDVPDLFAVLSDLSEGGTTLADLPRVLRTLGFRDITEREQATR